MELLKVCSTCKQRYPYNAQCPRCGSRHKVYDTHARGGDTATFYKSTAWRKLSQSVRAMHNYIDVYALDKHGIVKPSECVHHIVPVQDDYTRRLDITNLIPLSNQSHMEIEAMYRESETKKRDMIQYLAEIVGGKGSRGGQKSF